MWNYINPKINHKSWFAFLAILIAIFFVTVFIINLIIR